MTVRSRRPRPEDLKEDDLSVLCAYRKCRYTLITIIDGQSSGLQLQESGLTGHQSLVTGRVSRK